MALTESTVLESRALGAVNDVPVAASTTIYAGAMVMIDSNGYAAPASAAAGNKGVHGIALETQDNSAGGAGDVSVRIQAGEYRVSGTGLTQAMVGDVMFADADDNVDNADAGNEARAGIMTEYVSATQAFVLIGPAVAS